MRIISQKEIEKTLNFEPFIEWLEAFFRKNVNCPIRSYYQVGESDFLIMPAYDDQYFGVKQVSINSKASPSIQSHYGLFDAKENKPLIQFNSNYTTAFRTAATSALSSKYLSRENSRCLLMIGTGYLSEYMVRAHISVREIKSILLWGRNIANTQKLKERLQDLNGYEVELIEPNRLEDAIQKADIISSATSSKSPLIDGVLLKEGQHIDIVGSYKPSMREANDVCFKRSNVFVDSVEACYKESGDLSVPIANGNFKLTDIKGEITDLCSQRIKGRISNKEITLFKSVGLALEDLALACFLYEFAPK